MGDFSVRTRSKGSTSAVARLLLGIGVLGVLVGWGTAVHAQQTDTVGGPSGRYTVALRNVPLDDALQTVVTKTNVDLAYSTALVEGETAYCRVRKAPLDAVLSCVPEGTGIDYLRTDRGSYLLVKSPAVSPARGGIAGTVVDAATGEPLPNANVLLADANVGTSTDAEGQFTVAPVLAGKHRLAVTYVGYRTAVDSVQVPPDGRDTIRVALRRRVVEAPPVVVDGLQQRLPSVALGQSDLSASALSALSSKGTPDVLRRAGQEVGIALSRPLAEIHVQGGGNGEHVMQLDGVPIREPVTLGGLFSAFSPKALDRLTIHKAGFGAAHGSYTSGVLEARHDLSRRRTRYASAGVDPMTANGRVEGAWTIGERQGQIMGAGRTSLWDTYRASSLHDLLDTRTALDPSLTPSWTGQSLEAGSFTQNRTAHVQFRDLHGAVRQEVTPFQSLSVSGYRGTTQLGTDVASIGPAGNERRALLSQDRYDWTNTAVQGRYEWLASSRVTGRFQLWGSWHDSHTFFGIQDDSLSAFEGTPRPPDADERLQTPHSAEGNEMSEWGGRAAVDVSLSSETTLRAAVAPQFFRGTFRVRNPFLGIVEHGTEDWHIGSHAEVQFAPGLNVTATAGTRLTYVQARDKVYAEPRLSLRYDRSETPLGGLALRVAGGLYRQYVTQAEISSAGPTSVIPSVQFWLPVDASVAPARAYHTSGSLLLTPTSRWSARVEGYYKWQPRTLQVDYAGLVRSPTPSRPPTQRALTAQSDLLAAGQGRSYGTALHLQRQGDRLSGSVSAEWSRTERRYPGRFDGRFVPAPWEQPVRLTTDLDVVLTDGLHGLVHWEGIWGRSWALRRSYYDYLALAGTDPFPEYDLSRPGEQSLPTFSRLDVGLKSTFDIRDVTMGAEVRLVNVLDRRNAFDRSLSRGSPSSGASTRTLPGRRTVVRLGLRY